MGKGEILLAEDDGTLRSAIRASLEARALKVVEAATAAALLQHLYLNPALGLLIVDSKLQSERDGLDAVASVRDKRADIPIILIASDPSEDLAIAALRAGCSDYLRKPLVVDDLVTSVRSLLTHSHETVPSSSTSEMIGESPQMRAVRAYLHNLAATDTGALITGETGTGKELAAEMIHRHSARRNKPFVSINCAAIPDSLLESELFGYERGAFTGAQGAREGTLKQADGGTVFFDEIGDMSLYGQAKVLRALETREARPLGARRDVTFDIRVVAATNRDLEQLIAEQKFRADLFFRLNIASVHIPPLRSRKEDLVPLSRHYIAKMNHRSGLNVEGFGPETIDALIRYDWPGNVRELKNLVEAVFVQRPAGWISIADLPDSFRTRCAATCDPPESERDRVLSALMATNWNKSRAAEKLRWSRMTLYRKMSLYQVANASFSRTKR